MQDTFYRVIVVLEDEAVEARMYLSVNACEISPAGVQMISSRFMSSSSSNNKDSAKRLSLSQRLRYCVKNALYHRCCNQQRVPSFSFRFRYFTFSCITGSEHFTTFAVKIVDHLSDFTTFVVKVVIRLHYFCCQSSISSRLI